MQIRVLGPVDVVDDEGTNVALGGPAQQRLLAVLVAAAPGPASVDAVVEDLWAAGDPDSADGRPDDPVGTVRTYVARLRRVLGPEAVVTGTGAYTIGPMATDAARFEELVERARRLSGSPAAPDLWRQALDLWRGPAFGDHADLGSVRPRAARLDELRAEATEAWFDARLAAGEGRELAGEVETAIGRFPLREGFRAQQMTVLARAGRQAEALRAFQEFRAELTEIGLEPSKRLVDLDAEITRGETPRHGARRTLRGYELGVRIGEGAFAQVWRATQASVGREVAIKQIRAELADQPTFIAHFEAEAQLVARLEHPHIVPLYDYWREPGSAYLVMRHLDGGSLASRLVDGPADFDDIVRWVGQVAAGLDAAHRAGVIHRDVKSANILLDTVGNAYLSDFGIAVEEAERLDPEAWLSNGSPAYAPPEQLERHEVGPTADVYALAMTTFEALTGRLPFAGETTMAGLLKRQLDDPIPLARNLQPDIPAAVDTVLQRATAKDPADRYPSAGQLARDLAAAAGLEGDKSLITTENRNPYKGLRPFDEADAADFTGRDRLVGELARAVGGHRFVVVVGPSGSGKSSVVRAGLLPAVRAGRVDGSTGATRSDRWLVATMVPGASPFADLEAALLPVAVDPPPYLGAALRADDSGGLTGVLRRIIPDDRDLLLVVDQFEELFTLAPAAERDLFLTALMAAVTDDRSRLRVVATLRADFYDHPLRNPDLARLMRRATIPVHPLAADELERAITEPAAAVGARFEPGLVARITAEVNDQPGALPLLQYTLTELFDRRVDDTLTVETYEELGGVAGAIGRRAEDVHQSMERPAREATRRVFGRLVNLGEGTEDTRRRLRRSELPTDPAADPVADAVIDRFGRARLLSFDRDRATREPTVEVAHEALLRAWPRLRSWLDEDREGLRILRHLGESAVAWDQRGRHNGDLYRAGRLESALEWADDHADRLNSTEAAFLDAGRARAEAERVAEARRVRRLRRLLAAVAMVAAVAVIAGGLALVQRNRANDEATRADGNATDAQANAERAEESAAEAEANAAEAQARAEEAELTALVNRSLVEASTRPDVALLLAAEAYDRAQTPDTQRALLGALVNVPNRVATVDAPASLVNTECVTTSGPGRWVGGQSPTVLLDATGDARVLPFDAGCYAAEDPTRTRLAYDRRPSGVAIGDVETGEDLVVALPEREIRGPIAWSPDGTQLAVGVGEQEIVVVDATTGETVRVVERPQGYRNFDWYPDGRFGFDTLPEEDGEAPPLTTLTFTDGPGGATLFEVGDLFNVITGVDTRPDLGLLAVGDLEGIVRLVSYPDGEPVGEIDTGGLEFQGLSFSADGSRLYGVSGSAVVTLDVSARRVVGELGQFGSVRRVSGLADGRVAVLVEKGQVIVIDPVSGSTSIASAPCCPRGERTSMAFDHELATAFGVVTDTAQLTFDQVIIDVAAGERIPLDFDSSELARPGPLLPLPGRRAVLWDATGLAVYFDDAGREIERRQLSAGLGDHTVLTGTRTDDRANQLVQYGDDVELDRPTGFVVVELATGEQLGELIPYDFDEPVIAWGSLPDGSFVGVTTESNLWHWDLDGDRGAEPLAADASGSHPIPSLDGSLIAYRTVADDLAVIETGTGRLVHRAPSLGGTTVMGISGDNRRLVAMDSDGRAVLHDLETGREIGALNADSAAGARALPVPTADGTSMWLAFGAHWQKISLDPKVWRERACELAGRELTEEEWEEFVPGDEPRRDICAL